MNLKNNNGIGINGFSIKIIMAIADYLADPVIHIFNNYFLTGVFPDRLKHAKITPVYKADDKMSINIYRPISILPVFSKVLEKSIHEKLVSYFVERCNLLCVISMVL